MKIFQPPPTTATPLIGGPSRTPGKLQGQTPNKGEGPGVCHSTWYKWFQQVADNLTGLNAAASTGYTGSIPLAKITPIGTNGSLTVVNGLITAAVKPT